MKHVHESQSKPEGVRRPFRKLAIAGKVLAATAYVGMAGLFGVCLVNYDNDKKEQATREAFVKAQESLIETRGWTPISEYNGNWLYLDYNLRDLIANRNDKLRHARSPSERSSILADALDEFEWKMRLNMDPHAAISIGDTTRRIDSLRIVEAIMKEDSTGLMDELRYARKPDSRLGGKQRDSLISRVLDGFRPLLPQVRKKGQDSASIDSALSVVERQEALLRNTQKLRAILADRKTMVAALRGTWVDAAYVKAMTNYKSLLETFTVDEVRRDDWLRGVFMHQALRRFRAIKEPDGSSWKQDSAMAMSILNSAYAEIWDAYVNDPRVVRITPGVSGEWYEPHVSEPPPAPGPSQPMPHFVGRE